MNVQHLIEMTTRLGLDPSKVEIAIELDNDELLYVAKFASKHKFIFRVVGDSRGQWEDVEEQCHE